MQCDEDCRTAGFGKTERPVGWEGDGELSRVKLVRHCERGKPAGTDRLHLQALSHSFTLDILVTGRSQDQLEQEVKPVIEKFLAERGLELSSEKTRIIHVSKGFEFLGQHIRRYGNGKVLTKPAKQSISSLLDQVRSVVRRNRQATAGHLIVQLNPILRGWANYHRHAASKRTFG